MAKTITCKYCGESIPKSAKICPCCKKKVKHPVAALLCLLIIAVTMFFIVSIIQNTPTESSGITTGMTDQSIENNETQKSEKTVIVNDGTITAEFLGFDNYPELGMFTVNLSVVNKTDQKIWVYLDEASVNDEMMQLVTTGAPLNILPEKNGTNSFIFNFKQISISSFDEVNSVSFKICVKNEETLESIETTSEITLNKVTV